MKLVCGRRVKVHVLPRGGRLRFVPSVVLRLLAGVKYSRVKSRRRCRQCVCVIAVWRGVSVRLLSWRTATSCCCCTYTTAFYKRFACYIHTSTLDYVSYLVIYHIKIHVYLVLRHNMCKLLLNGGERCKILPLPGKGRVIHRRIIRYHHIMCMIE